MVLQSASAPQARRRCPRASASVPTPRRLRPLRRLPVRDDLQPAADELRVRRNPPKAGCAATRSTRSDRSPARACRFHVRLDAAGQYADNLLHFPPSTRQANRTPRRRTRRIRVGDRAEPDALVRRDPQRNKNYRSRPLRQSEVRSLSRPAPRLDSRSPSNSAATPPLAHERRVLRQVAGRLQAARPPAAPGSSTNCITCSPLPSPSWPCSRKISPPAGSSNCCIVIPRPRGLAGASETDLGNIAYLPARHVAPLLERGAVVDRFLERACRRGTRSRSGCDNCATPGARQKRLEKPAGRRLSRVARRQLPRHHPGHRRRRHRRRPHRVRPRRRAASRRPASSSPTSASCRSRSPAASTATADHTRSPPRRFVASRRGNDLVRRYLWMAALSPVRNNPADTASPVCAGGPESIPTTRPSRSATPCCKLLHLAWAVWKNRRRPFDRQHYPWQAPAHIEGESDIGLSQEEQAAGRKRSAESDEPTEPVQDSGPRDLRPPAYPIPTRPARTARSQARTRTSTSRI